jgi:pilus assembly protein Flp/PilA
MRHLLSFLTAKDGATAIEYGLIAGIIAIALIAGFGTMTNSLLTVFQQITDAITAVWVGK